MASMKPTRAKKTSIMSFDPTATITVRVGEHPVLRRAMNGSRKEAETRIIELPDDDPEDFALYINYVYTASSLLRLRRRKSSALSRLRFEGHVEDEYITLFNLYVLAERLQDVATKTAILEAAMNVTELMSKEGKWLAPPTYAVNTVYGGTPPNSSARRFLVDVRTALAIPYLFKNIHLLNKDFVQDLGESMAELKVNALGNLVKKNGIAAYLEEIEEK